MRIFDKVLGSSTLMVMTNLLVKSALILLISPLGAKLLPGQEAINWVLAVNLVSLTVVFDLGFAAIISRYVTHVRVRGDAAGYSLAQTQAAARRIYAGLAALYAIFIVLLGGYLLAGRGAGDGLAGILIVTLLLGPIYLFLNHHYALLMGGNQVAYINRVQAIAGAVCYPLALLALFMGLGASCALLVIYAGLVVPGLIFRHRLADEPRPAVSAAQTARLQDRLRGDVSRAALGVGFSLVIYNASAYYYGAELQAEPFLLGSLIVMQMLRGVASFAQAPFYSKLPVMNALYADGKWREFLRFGGIRGGIVLALFVVFSLLAYVLVLNVDTRVYDLVPAGVSPAFYFVLAVALLAERLAAMLMQMYTATGHVIWHTVNGLSGLAQILLTWWWIDTMGLLSFPLALLVSSIVLQLPIVTFYLAREHRRQMSWK